MKFLTIILAYVVIYSTGLWIQAFAQKSFYCDNCLMHFGTEINSEEMVTNQNTLFNLPRGSTLNVHVNVFDCNGKSLDFSKTNILIVQRDSKMNDLAVIVDEYMDQIDPKSWGFSFF